MLRLRWTSRRPDGREYTIVDGPIRFGGDEHSDIVLSLTMPHIMGGTVRTDFAMPVGVTETLTLTLEADPPDED